MRALSTQKMRLAAVCLAIGAAGSCSSRAPADVRRALDDPAAAHLELAVAAPIDSQSTGMSIEVFRCGESRPMTTAQIGYSAGSLDELEHFSDTPVRLDKRHLFARTHLSLGHGCYVVAAQPHDTHRQPLDRCSRAKTPELPLGPRVERSLLLVARCGDMPSDTPMIGGRLNFGPRLTELTSRFDLSSGAFEVCAHTFDPEGDQVRVEWHAQTDSGRRIETGEVSYIPRSPGNGSPRNGSPGDGPNWRRSACIQIAPADESVELTAVAHDGLDHSVRGFLSFEAYRLYRYGIAAPSRARKEVHLPLRRSNRPAE